MTDTRGGREIALVVPTIRENCLKDFFVRWNDLELFSHVDLIVMEDNPLPTFNISELPLIKGESGGSIRHLSWKNIREDLKLDEWIIPRRSDTVRSYAYWKAWKMGYKYILTLDDDCYPCTGVDGMTYSGQAFVNEHMKNLESRSKWFNTLNSVKPRGIPFYNVGRADNMIVNHGLWTNVLDYDAPYQLANPIKEEFSFDNRVVPSGLYFPMCGMNVMWKAEYTVLMYHLLMGQTLVKNQAPLAPGDEFEKDMNGNPRTSKLPFDRFGDIWCGILMKKVADHLRLGVSTGMPYIRHERASNPFTNLRKEANGIEVNEDFWKFIDDLDLGGVEKGSDPAVSAYTRIGAYMKEFTRLYPKYAEHTAYFNSLGEAMIQWAALFSKE